MSPRALLKQSERIRSEGFSLVEVIIAVALLVIISTGSLMIFNITTRQNNQSKGRQEEQSAISADLATIQTMNDRYECTAANSTSTGCTVAESDPNENAYYADVTSPSDASDSFDAACLDGTLIDGLIESINELDTPAAFAQLGISRSAAATPDESDRSPLRYTVTWTRTSGSVRLRQITLAPTVANWCP